MIAAGHRGIEPYPVHQRRFLVDSASLLSGSPDAAARAIRACRWWQQEYVGAVFVSVPAGRPGGLSRLDLIRRFLSAGCSPALLAFYSASDVAGLGPLSELVRMVRPGSGRGASNGVAWPAVTEVLGVGATDLVGASTELSVAARLVASDINRILGDPEIPLPVRVAERDLATGTAGPAAPTRSEISDFEAVALLAEGTRRVELEFEQRIDLLRAAVAAVEQPAMAGSARWPDVRREARGDG
jgi:hypothetical protein